MLVFQGPRPPLSPSLKKKINKKKTLVNTETIIKHNKKNVRQCRGNNIQRIPKDQSTKQHQRLDCRREREKAAICCSSHQASTPFPPWSCDHYLHDRISFRSINFLSISLCVCSARTHTAILNALGMLIRQSDSI